MILHQIILTSEERKALLNYLSEGKYFKSNYSEVENDIKAKGEKLYDAYKSILQSRQYCYHE